MKRRYLLEGIGILIGTITAGCIGSAQEESANLRIKSINNDDTEPGKIKLEVLVANEGQKTGKATLRVIANIKQKDKYESSRKISVGPGSLRRFKFSFNVGSKSISDSEYSTDARLE